MNVNQLSYLYLGSFFLTLGFLLAFGIHILAGFILLCMGTLLLTTYNLLTS